MPNTQCSPPLANKDFFLLTETHIWAVSGEFPIAMCARQPLYQLRYILSLRILYLTPSGCQVVKLSRRQLIRGVWDTTGVSNGFIDPPTLKDGRSSHLNCTGHLHSLWRRQLCTSPPCSHPELPFSSMMVLERLEKNLRLSFFITVIKYIQHKLYTATMLRFTAEWHQVYSHSCVIPNDCVSPELFHLPD